MPLGPDRDPPPPLGIRPVRTIIAVLVASAAFVLLLVGVARYTRDHHSAPPRDVGVIHEAGSVSPAPVPVEALNADAGTSAFFTDGGSIGEHAGERGEAAPAGPDCPVDLASLKAAAIREVERCAADAVRWDPSLGGAFTLEVTLAPEQAPALLLRGLESPVLQSCLQRAHPAFAAPVSQGVTVILVGSYESLAGRATLQSVTLAD